MRLLDRRLPAWKAWILIASSSSVLIGCFPGLLGQAYLNAAQACSTKLQLGRADPATCLRYFGAAEQWLGDRPAVDVGRSLPLLEMGELDAGLAALCKAAVDAPEYRVVHLLLLKVGLKLWYQGQPESALAAWKCIRGTGIAALLKAGESAELRRESPLAEDLYTAAGEASSGRCFRAYHRLGEIYFGSGRYAQAAEAYGRALCDPLGGYELQQHIARGKLCWIQQQWDCAIREFHAAIGLRPESSELHALLGNALSRSGNEEPAIAEFRLAEEFGPPFSWEPAFRIGYHCLGQGRFDEAVVWLERALVRTDDPALVAETYVQLGVAHSNLGALHLARQMILRGVELAPENGRYTYLLEQIDGRLCDD